MKIAGLTGGIGSGKSTVSAIFQDLGAEIIDADLLAREVVQPGRWAWKKIVAHFGPDFLLADKQIDRERLGAVIFTNPTERRFLNRVTHPPIYYEFFKMFFHYLRKRPPLVIMDAALLLETPLRKISRRVIVVETNQEVQIQRLMNRDGLARNKALQRIQSQMSNEKRRELADYTIDNSGTKKDTEKQVHELWKQLTANKS